MKIKNMIKKLRKKTGSFSIMFVILSFIAVLIASGLVDIVGKSFALNEVQSIMDVAGVSSLQAGVDTTKLRVEEFYVDETYVKQAYRAQTGSLIKPGTYVKGFTIERMNFGYENSQWGLGVTSSDRPQAYLDVVAKLRIKSSTYFDTIPSISKRFYNSRGGNNFTVTYNGVTSDGNIELIVRSVSRIVYR